MDKRTCNCVALAVVAAAAWTGVAIASPVMIANYGFTSDNYSSDAEPNSVAQTFVYNTHGTRSTSTRSAVKTYADVAANSEAFSLTANESFEFTVVPSAGYKLALNDLAFTSSVNVTNLTSTSFNGAFFVRSSLDGYSTNLASFTQPYDPMNFVARGVALSDSSFKDIRSAVTFRIYVYETGSGSSSAFDGLRVDNVVLNGEVTLVPEPMSLGLVGLAGLGLLARRSGARRPVSR